MLRAMLVAAMLSGCVDASSDPAVSKAGCGDMPSAPSWEFSVVAGAPAQAQMNLDIWYAQLVWRRDVLDWASCVTGVYQPGNRWTPSN